MPSALAKLKPIHPLPKCLGSFAIRPLRTGAGNPMEARSNFHPHAVSLSFAISCCGLIREPEGNSRSSRDDRSSFTVVPPTSTTKTFLFMNDGPDALGVLAVASCHSPKTLEDAALFWFCCRAGWPAFHDFEGNKPEEHLFRRLQIESQVLRNLLYRAAAIELRCELRLIRSQLQLLDTLEAIFCKSRNRRWFEMSGLIDILNK